jgi:hypothetical protein
VEHRGRTRAAVAQPLLAARTPYPLNRDEPPFRVREVEGELGFWFAQIHVDQAIQVKVSCDSQAPKLHVEAATRHTVLGRFTWNTAGRTRAAVAQPLLAARTPYRLNRDEPPFRVVRSKGSLDSGSLQEAQAAAAQPLLAVPAEPG